MKKTAVIGLGIIGGSICKSLRAAGFFVAGKDRDEKLTAYAVQEGIISERAERLDDYDTVFLAVPPHAAMDILQNGCFKQNALVMDICGVKTEIEKIVYEKPRNFRYVGLHPMAGKETSGISSSDEKLFIGANLIVTLSPFTEESAVQEVYEYAEAMGFGKIRKCTAEEHDRKIALTSQLAHVVSNAYVKSAEVHGCEDFTGGSFQDMTRIAGVDENMWTELYMLNRENLVRELNSFIEHLEVCRRAIEEGNESALKAELKTGRLCRESIKKEKNKK